MLLTAAAWAHLAAGNRKRGLELVGQLRPEVRSRFGESIIGGASLVAVAEVALLLEDLELVAEAERFLEPYAHLMLGLPWAPALAASDPLSRLATARGDDEAAQRYARQATDLYTALGADSLRARVVGSD